MATSKKVAKKVAAPAPAPAPAVATMAPVVEEAFGSIVWTQTQWATTKAGEQLAVHWDGFFNSTDGNDLRVASIQLCGKGRYLGFCRGRGNVGLTEAGKEGGANAAGFFGTLAAAQAAVGTAVGEIPIALQDLFESFAQLLKLGEIRAAHKAALIASSVATVQSAKADTAAAEGDFAASKKAAKKATEAAASASAALITLTGLLPVNGIGASEALRLQAEAEEAVEDAVKASAASIDSAETAEALSVERTAAAEKLLASSQNLLAALAEKFGGAKRK